MLAANYDITLDRAADYSFVLTIQNQAGAAVNLTGAQFYADVREVASKKEALELTTGIISPATGGQVLLSLTNEETKTLRAGEGLYSYDIFMVLGGATRRLLYGAVNVRPQFTNDV
jgi:hypothetical protein